MSLQLFKYGVSNLWVKDRFGGVVKLLLIISLTTLVDLIRVLKACTSGE